MYDQQDPSTVGSADTDEPILNVGVFAVGKGHEIGVTEGGDGLLKGDAMFAGIEPRLRLVPCEDEIHPLFSAKSLERVTVILVCARVGPAQAVSGVASQAVGSSRRPCPIILWEFRAEFSGFYMEAAAYGILRPFGKGFEDIRWKTPQTPD